jgi:hypothetical protein
MTALLLVHGRSQEMAAGADRSAAAVAAYVEGRKREWLGGLARGLTLAGHPPVRPEDVYYPFYGNLLADLIAEHERAGGHTPDLESAPVAAVAKKATRTHDDLILEAAEELGFRPSRRLARTDPELVAPVVAVERARAAGAEAGWSDLLKPRIVREALQFLAEKTGTSELIIQQFLRDVAYYLEDDRMRTAVQKEVSAAVDRAVADGHHDMVVVAHSLGSIVAYDLCADFTASIRVRLLVTAGSPLGYPIVRRNLRGGVEGADDRSVPAVLDPIPGSPGRDRVWWLNAFDVLDVVALVHPLASRFSSGPQRIRDERTFNPTAPHSVSDYLSDPDVAGPIGDVLAHA